LALQNTSVLQNTLRYRPPRRSRTPQRVLLFDSNSQTQKSAAVFAVRRANYTHRRKGVFNAGSIVDLTLHWQCAKAHRNCRLFFL